MEERKKISPENDIPLEEFNLELLSAVNVCFEGKAEQSGGAIIFTAPSGQKFRIRTEHVE